MHLSRLTRGACSQHAHPSGGIGQNPRQGVASKSGFTVRPFAADLSHDLLCGDSRQREGQPIHGQGKDVSIRLDALERFSVHIVTSSRANFPPRFS